MFDRTRRVQAWTALGASNTINEGCGVARQKNVYNPRR